MKSPNGPSQSPSSSAPRCALGQSGDRGDPTARDFVYDPGLVHNQNGSVVLHQMLSALGTRLPERAPTFLSTPHGLEDTNDFMVYRSSKAAGFAELGDGE